MRLLEIFQDRKPVIGVLHLPPLPGSPGYAGALPLAQAIEDAMALENGGVDAVLLENFGDAPFSKGPVEPHTIAAMTRIATSVRERLEIPFGLNVLRNDARAALAIASVCQGSFVRVNVLSGVYATDQGIIEGDAARVLRYRDRVAPGLAILADVHVKHARCLSHHTLEEAARDTARRGLADALVVTGSSTGSATSLEDLATVKKAVPDLPLLAGSGVSPDNIRETLTVSDGVIVGTFFKKDGRVEASNVRALVEAARSWSPQ